MKEYVLTENDIEYLKRTLKFTAIDIQRCNNPNISSENIMIYNKICKCDDFFFCEHRLEWLIKYIENKEIKTRQTKLKKLKNEN